MFIFINLFYFRYVNAVDKALKSFEYTSEWADLISALGKLNKVKTNTQAKCMFINYVTKPNCTNYFFLLKAYICFNFNIVTKKCINKNQNG